MTTCKWWSSAKSKDRDKEYFHMEKLKATDRKRIFKLNYDVGRGMGVHKEAMSRWKVRGF